MEAHKDFERLNARLWDETSSIAAPSEAGDGQDLRESSTVNPVSLGPQSAIPLPNNPIHLGSQLNVENQRSRASSTGNTVNLGLQSAIPPTDSPTNLRGKSNAENGPAGGGLYGRSRNQPSPKGRRPPLGAQGEERIRRSCTDPELKSSTGWAAPTPLEKTRQAVQRAVVAENQAIVSRYLSAPDLNTLFPATGLFLWPNKSVHPSELLGGQEMTELNIIRTTHFVFITWDSQKRCLRICSERSDVDIIAAVKAIRAIIKSAEAKHLSSTPLYIVVPPSADAMRKTVAPKEVISTEHGGRLLVGVMLDGDELSREEKFRWAMRRKLILETNSNEFKDHLSGICAKLAYIPRWMRMRVHFGHVHLSKFEVAYANSEYDFPAFCKMMKNDMMTGGLLNRKIDGSFATKIVNRILESPLLSFRPAETTLSELQVRDVEPKHTLILFIQTGDERGLRLEADIEVMPEPKAGKGRSTMLFEAGTATGQCQLGTTYAFWNDKQNKRADITTVDIESGFDWTFEVIENGERPPLTNSLCSLLNGSIDGQTTMRKDSLGLKFPGITPKVEFGREVDDMVVRSVYSYEFGPSDYIVEIAVYRLWTKRAAYKVWTKSLSYEVWKAQPKNKGKDPRSEFNKFSWKSYVADHEPSQIQSSMSMYKRGWDWETDEVWDKTTARNWDPQLKCFFGEEEDGIPKFLESVKFLLDFLTEVEQE